MSSSTIFSSGLCGPLRRPRLTAALWGAVLATLACGLALAFAPAAGARVHGMGDARAATSVKGKTIAASRRALIRAVRRNPKLLRRPGFLRKALIVPEMNLPITIRFATVVNQAGAERPPDDVLELDFGTGAAPVGPLGSVFAGVQPTTLTGKLRGFLHLNRETSGYGEFGVFEVSITEAIVAGTSFPIVESGATADNDILKTEPVVAFSAASPGDGFMSIVTHRLALTLRLNARFNSLVRPNLTAAFAWTKEETMAGDEALLVKLDAATVIDPAITADGRLRLAKLEADNAIRPQPVTPTNFSTCTLPTVPPVPETDPQPAGTCDGVAGDDINVSTSSRFKTFSAELLIGVV